jgi:hypothetical protein
MWFKIQAQAARTIEEHGAHFIGHIITALQVLSPGWAWPMLGSAPQEYQARVTLRNDEIELWYLPQIWVEDVSTPEAYQPVPKEWIVHPGVECFIAPAGGVNGRAVAGERIPNPGGFITRVAE